MARFYRRKRFARRLRRAFRGKKTSMARIKKDIMKCNFPTKVKFMGLTEKKVMFLTQTMNLTLDAANNRRKQIILNPLNAKNLVSVCSSKSIQVRAGNNTVRGTINYSNWDKICILGIYIKFQPIKNMWDGQNGDISQVICTYSQNNLDMDTIALVQDGNAVNYSPADYDNDCKDLKQQFIFNSNEAFTMYLPAPPTMCSTDPSLHRSKSWWSLINIKPNFDGANFVNDDMDNSVDDDMDEDIPILEAGPIQPANDARPYIHAGRLFFSTQSDVGYNITINYKVALKG